MFGTRFQAALGIGLAAAVTGGVALLSLTPSCAHSESPAKAESVRPVPPPLAKKVAPPVAKSEAAPPKLDIGCPAPVAAPVCVEDLRPGVSISTTMDTVEPVPMKKGPPPIVLPTPLPEKHGKDAKRSSVRMSGLVVVEPSKNEMDPVVPARYEVSEKVGPNTSGKEPPMDSKPSSVINASPVVPVAPVKLSPDPVVPPPGGGPVGPLPPPVGVSGGGPPSFERSYPTPTVATPPAKEPTPDEVLRKARDEEKRLTNELVQKHAQLRELESRCQDAKGQLIKALAKKVQSVALEMQALQQELQKQQSAVNNAASSLAAPTDAGKEKPTEKGAIPYAN